MNRAPFQRVAALIALIAVGGCGTFHNLDDGEGRIFGGVRTDLAMTGLCALAPSRTTRDTGNAATCSRSGRPFWLSIFRYPWPEIR